MVQWSHSSTYSYPRHWRKRSWTFRPFYPRVVSLLFPLYKAGGVGTETFFLNAAEKKISCVYPIANTIRRYCSPLPSHFTNWASVACSLTELCQLQTQQLGIIGLEICWAPRFQAMLQQCNATVAILMSRFYPNSDSWKKKKTRTTPPLSQSSAVQYVISSFHGQVDKICALLGYCESYLLHGAESFLSS